MKSEVLGGIGILAFAAILLTAPLLDTDKSVMLSTNVMGDGIYRVDIGNYSIEGRRNFVTEIGYGNDAPITKIINLGRATINYSKSFSEEDCIGIGGTKTIYGCDVSKLKNCTLNYIRGVGKDNDVLVVLIPDKTNKTSWGVKTTRPSSKERLNSKEMKSERIEVMVKFYCPTIQDYYVWKGK